MGILVRNNKVISAGGKILYRNVSPFELPNLKLYLSATRMVQQADESSVSSFTDFSGNSYHATQGTSGFQPKFDLNQFGGSTQAGIKFDAIDDRLIFNTAILKNTNVYTFQMLCKRNVLGTVGMFCYISTPSGVSRLNINTTATSVSVAARVVDGEGAGSVTFVSNDLLEHLLQVTLNAGTMYVYWDGVLKGQFTFASTTISNTDSVGCSMGANSGALDNFLSCAIQGVSLSYNYSDPATIQAQYRGCLQRGYL